MKLYAIIEFKTGDVGRYGDITDIGLIVGNILPVGFLATQYKNIPKKHINS